MGKEEGGGFRMGNTCIPVADSFRYLAKPIQYCKVKKKKFCISESVFAAYLFLPCWAAKSTDRRGAPVGDDLQKSSDQ